MAHVNAQEVTIPWRKRTDVISLFLKAYPEDFEVDEVSTASYFSYQLTLPEKDYHELFDAMQKYEDEFMDITGSF